MFDFYQEEMIAEFKEPQNRGKLVGADIAHQGKNASCGDDINVFLKFDKSKIADVKWDGHGCVVSITSMSLLSEKLKGKTIDEVMSWTKEDLLPFFGMDELNKGREKCFMLGLNAVQQAITKWKN
jgi:nitrogen fixation NifU-like protein